MPWNIDTMGCNVTKREIRVSYTRCKRWVSEINGSQPMHETFWWRCKELVTSQLTDLINWPMYLQKSIKILEHIDTCDREAMTLKCRRSAPVQLCLIYFYNDGTGILVGAIRYLILQRSVRCIADTCNYAPLPYWGEDRETNGDTLVSPRF